MSKGSIRTPRIPSLILVFVLQIINAKDYQQLYDRYPQLRNNTGSDCMNDFQEMVM